MTRQERIEQFNIFIAFLTEHGVASEYYVCMLKEDSADSFEQLIDEVHASSWISTVFTWSDSPSGHTYWSSLNYKWQGILGNEDIQR